MLPNALHLALQHIATEMAEAVDADGYTVDDAMAVNPCFSSSQARAMLLRDIVTDAADKACSRDGVLDFRTVNGSGRELRYFHGGTDFRYRIRRANRVGDEVRIRANSDSALAHVADPDQYVLVPEEQWVMGWSTDDDGAVDEVFVARSFGADASGNWLELGTIHPLLLRSGGSGGPGEGVDVPGAVGPASGFTPTDESLPGFEDGQGQGGDAEIDDADYGSGS